MPALDVSEGRLAMHTPDGPRPVEAFEGDPMAAAAAYKEAGAAWVHVVDLDLAFTGAYTHLDLLGEIAGLGLSVQASGGITNLSDARRATAAGAARVVIGSGALLDEDETWHIIDELAGRAIIGLELVEGHIEPRGRVVAELGLAETLGWLTAAGARAFLVTAVARVGGLAGPDLDDVRRVIRAGRPVLAAGGVASIADLEVLRRAGAAGAVVGRAAIEGGLDLRAAFGQG